MMYDAIVVGSGPAGVSAAFPLVQAGKSVLMLDWGNVSKLSPPSTPHYESRSSDNSQWKWMLGEDFHANKNVKSVSPKLRIPTLSYVFDDFEKSFDVSSTNFFATGSLATGGLSNAWGAGVAALGSNEIINNFGTDYKSMFESYASVAKRVGISGKRCDDMSNYFGVDKWADDPIELDQIPSYIINKHEKLSSCKRSDVRVGRSRIAVLSKDQSSRKKCDKSGNCLWGCSNQSIYSSKYDLNELKKWENFTYTKDVLVNKVSNDSGKTHVYATNRDGDEVMFEANNVLLAAGTLATTKILVNSLGLKNVELNIQSSPTAAFLLAIPKFFGRKVKNSEFGLGQVSYSLDLDKKLSAFGSFFSTQGLPLFEFVRHLPIGVSTGSRFLGAIMNSCLVGNLFLPGTLSRSKCLIGNNGEIEVVGGYDESYKSLGKLAKKRLSSHFRKLNCFIVPLSFKFTEPGACIHYASTFPMKNNPKLGETTMKGEVFGLDNVFAVDGTSLPFLSEKSHTLTIMANADRISTWLANK